MMETQVLIQEIQKKHHITLRPDDPVFVAVTLNDMLLSHYMEKFQALLEAQNKLVVSEGIERLNQASAMGSEMINRSLEALSQTLEEGTTQIADQVMALIDRRSKIQIQEPQKKIHTTKWGVYVVVACSFFILGIIFKSFS